MITSAPKLFAKPQRNSLKSIPITLHPFALRICTAKSPTSPKPWTTIVSPIVGFNNLTPCKATNALGLKPTSENAADAKGVACL